MLRIVSYNIHSGRDLFWRNRLQQMARTLGELQADVIGLQEVHQNSKYGYQADYLAGALQYHSIFAPSIRIADGTYGNALLTRLPILRSRTLSLPAKKEKRCLLQSTLLWKGTEFDTWVTHLSLNQVSRLEQIDMLMTLAKKQQNHPLILVGDFNTTSASFQPILTDCARITCNHLLPTLPSFRRRIDYLFASRHWRVGTYQLIDVRWSDHVPLAATLELSERQVPAE
ncbi:endonuclease/exonuclease/phosphatase family protein [Brevibacillus sp. H7]|uniref:endonuclease/exonuclease/phosphatase family protein n=1 Tax=Brevibacillus sp. H7 TaxID=3349138 RepID=UPI00381D27B1